MTASRTLAGSIREISVLAGCLLAGLMLIPLALYFASAFVLGNYGGSGYAEFFSTLLNDVRAGQTGAWILVISPYAAIQALRLSILGWLQCGAIRSS
jgi:hypothetical protein